MRAAVLLANRKIEILDVPSPRYASNDVVVEVKAVGICGSDLPRYYENKAHHYPLILGHEFSGIIVDKGKDAASFSLGDHVVGIPLLSCGECPNCLKGNYSSCVDYNFIGSRRDGAIAEYISVPARNLWRIDPQLPFIQAALFEVATVALHAILHSDFRPGTDVAVVGCGSVGLFLVQWLRILGAKTITVVGRSKTRLMHAKQVGADEVFSVLEMDDPWRSAFSLTQSGGFDYVYEATGSSKMMASCLSLAAYYAMVCYVGTPSITLSFEPDAWELLNRRKLRLAGSWMSYSAPFPGKEWIMTRDYLAKAKLIIRPDVVYKVLPLEKTQEAFNLFRDKSSKVRGKVLIAPNG